MSRYLLLNLLVLSGDIAPAAEFTVASPGGNLVFTLAQDPTSQADQQTKLSLDLAPNQGFAIILTERFKITTRANSLSIISPPVS